jgi:hypothetical protein
MTCQPATIDEVLESVAADLAKCSPSEIEQFQKYRIPPVLVPILRFSQQETVVAIAKKGKEVLFWEDVEEGFVISPLSSDGIIVDYNVNQDTLSLALRYWLPN